MPNELKNGECYFSPQTRRHPVLQLDPNGPFGTGDPITDERRAHAIGQTKEGSVFEVYIYRKVHILRLFSDHLVQAQSFY